MTTDWLTEWGVLLYEKQSERDDEVFNNDNKQSTRSNTMLIWWSQWTSAYTVLQCKSARELMPAEGNYCNTVGIKVQGTVYQREDFTNFFFAELCDKANICLSNQVT